MTKAIEFNIPTTTGIKKARGIPARFIIGGRKIKFVLQHNGDGKIAYLTHFASGQRFGSLNDIAVEVMCKLSPYHGFSKHRLAQLLVDNAVAKYGADKVLEKIDSVPVIN